MDFTIRNEQKSDYRTVEELTKEAFWNHYAPGCSEHYLANVMRGKAEFIHELDMVAVADDNTIVGNIMYAKTYLLDDNNNNNDKKHETITFGPVSVLPSFQSKGIGGRLIEETKKTARAMGFSAIIIYGDPDYYSRFGFEPAENYGIKTADGMYAVSLQVFYLNDSLKGVHGRFFEGEGYAFDEDNIDEFDKDFPRMEKGFKKSQERFNELVKMRHE